MQEVTVSIVSHGHGELLAGLLRQIDVYRDQIAKVIITFNIPETLIFSPKEFGFETVILHNKTPKGFGQNHNQAFQYCWSDCFCVLNPDIAIIEEPFRVLIKSMKENKISIIAPRIVNPAGEIEDNARYFPNPFDLIKKVFGRYNGVYTMNETKEIINPDWVAGMFMLIPSVCYARLGGFDEGFYLYYEDVDLCLRAWERNMTIGLHTGVAVVHDARRQSHTSPSFFIWHLKSVLRYFRKHMGYIKRRRSLRAGLQ